MPEPVLAQTSQSLHSIRQAAGRYARKRAKYLLPKAKITVKIAHLDPRLRFEQCARPLQPSTPSGSSRLGHTVIDLRCTGPHPWQLYVPVTVIAEMSVLVAAHPLQRGDHIKKGMLTYAERNLAQLPYGYFVHPKTVIGRVLSRNLLSGAVVTPAALHSPLLVQRGQVVTLSAGTSAFTVTTQGVALQGGSLGALVRVRNTRSNQVVQGKVIGSGRVRING